MIGHCQQPLHLGLELRPRHPAPSHPGCLVGVIAHLLASGSFHAPDVGAFRQPVGGIIVIGRRGPKQVCSDHRFMQDRCQRDGYHELFSPQVMHLAGVNVHVPHPAQQGSMAVI